MNTLKKYVLCSIVFLGTISPILVGTGLGLHMEDNQSKAEAKMADILKSEGYEQFNQQYKIESVNSLNEALDSGDITIEAYIDEIQNLADYNEEEYISEYATAESQVEYSVAKENYEKNSHIIIPFGVVMSSIFTIPLGVGVINSIREVFDKPKNEKTKEKV